MGITDPFGAHIGYNREVIGRVTSVTGSGYGNVTSYASNIQYRAWGSQKSASYGDGSSATTAHNARMQPSSYTLSPSSLKLHEQFQYYADGRLQLMTDLDDRNQDPGYPDTARHFSRAHSYDQVGRLTSANGSPSQSLPYTQNFSYDAFNNATAHWGTYYYQTQSTDSATFLNNRRQNWTYYADGQVKHSPLAYDVNFNETMYRDWTYDAAGRMIQTKETVTANNSVSTYVTSYVGDGQFIREYLQEGPTNNSYSVRSSVLGGKVLTRLDNSGNKTTTIFEVDGMLTAVQSPSGGFQSVTWTHTDPLGLSTAGDTKSVYDPLGKYVSWQHAPTAPPNSYPPFSPSFGGLGSAFGASQDKSCTFNGQPITCTELLHDIDIGIVGWEAISGGQRRTGDVTLTGLHQVNIWVADSGPRLGLVEEKDDDVVRVNHDDDGLGHYESFLLSVAPQNPQQQIVGFDHIWDDLADIIKDGTCRSFIGDLIGTAQETTGKKAHAFSVEGMLAELKNHPMNGTKGIGLFPTGANGGAAGWDEKTGLGFANLDSETYVGPLRIAERSLALWLLHEIIHTATKERTSPLEAYGGFNDVELARAVFRITGDPKDNIDNPANIAAGTKFGPIARGGIIWDRALRRYCK